MKYGSIDYVAYQPEEPSLGIPKYNEVEGTIFKMQLAASYGIGLKWHPISAFTIFANFDIINRLTNEPLDVYRKIGFDFGL